MELALLGSARSNWLGGGESVSRVWSHTVSSWLQLEPSAKKLFDADAVTSEV